MPHKGHDIQCRYSKVSLQQAVDMVKSGTMSVRDASSHFHVPKSTLQDHASGKVQPGAKYGNETVIPIDIEQEMANKVRNAADQGFGISRLQMMFKAGQIVKQMKLKSPFKNNIPGRAWYEGFVKRHNLSLRTPSPLTTNRSRALNTSHRKILHRPH